MSLVRRILLLIGGSGGKVPLLPPWSYFDMVGTIDIREQGGYFDMAGAVDIREKGGYFDRV